MSVNPVFHVVLVEWDGMKPPTTWYNRLRSMGLRVNGNKSESPLQRRACGSGVIYQEGMIMVNTPEQAVCISQLATSMGATNVVTGELAIEGFSMTEKERTVLSNLQQRGRPSRESDKVKMSKHSMTCYSEMKTMEVTPKTLANEGICPVCGSTRVSMRVGAQTRAYPFVGREDIYSYWLKTHFINGTFEKPVFDNSVINEENEYSDTTTNLLRSTKLYSAIMVSKIQPEKLLRVLDTAYDFWKFTYASQDNNEIHQKLTNNHLKGFSVYYQINQNPRLDGSLVTGLCELSMIDLLPQLERGNSPLKDLTTEEILELCDASI